MESWGEICCKTAFVMKELLPPNIFLMNHSRLHKEYWNSVCRNISLSFIRVWFFSCLHLLGKAGKSVKRSPVEWILELLYGWYCCSKSCHSATCLGKPKGRWIHKQQWHAPFCLANMGHNKKCPENQWSLRQGYPMLLHLDLYQTTQEPNLLPTVVFITL